MINYAAKFDDYISELHYLTKSGNLHENIELEN